MTNATIIVIGITVNDAQIVDRRPQIPHEQAGRSDHHHDAVAGRRRELRPSPRSMALNHETLTTQRVARQPLT